MSNWSLLVITCEAAAGILLPVLGSPLQKRCWYWNESIRQTKTISLPKHMAITKHWKKLACSALRWQDLEGLRRWGVKLQQEISMLSSTTSWECKGKQRAKPFLKGYRIRCNKDKAETLIKVFLHWLDKSFSSLVVVGCCICLFVCFFVLGGCLSKGTKHWNKLPGKLVVLPYFDTLTTWLENTLSNLT